MSEFMYDENSPKSWAEQAGEYNAKLLAEQLAQPREKTEMEIVKETVDMLVVTMLGGDTNV